MDATAMQDRASDLEENIRYRKRIIRENRKVLKTCGRELAELREKCQEFGIELIIENPSEGRPHGSAETENRRHDNPR